MRNKTQKDFSTKENLGRENTLYPKLNYTSNKLSLEDHAIQRNEHRALNFETRPRNVSRNCLINRPPEIYGPPFPNLEIEREKWVNLKAICKKLPRIMETEFRFNRFSLLVVGQTNW